MIDFRESGLHPDLPSDDAGGQVFDADTCANAFFVNFEIVDQDFSRGDLHLMDERPGGATSMNEHAVKCRAHVGSDGEQDLTHDAGIEVGFHKGVGALVTKSLKAS